MRITDKELIDRLTAVSKKSKAINELVVPMQLYQSLIEEVSLLRLAIRRHRDFRGDDRCWMDDHELYEMLPEGYAPPSNDTFVCMENCLKYIRMRKDPSVNYESPQRRIEQLEAVLAEVVQGHERIKEAMGSHHVRPND